MLEEAEKCPGCGHPMDETTDHDLRLEWEEVDMWCYACERKQSAVEVERADQADTTGRIWSVRRRR